MKRGTTRLVTAVLILIIAAVVSRWRGQTADAPPSTRSDDAVVAEAFASRRSDVLVTVVGTVSRVLPDDEDGARHQRFLVDLARGPSLLVAHNIDLADRVPLAVGDTVTVCGEYEWNDRGGVVHWTHHDPRGRREGGWIRHDGSVYR